MEKAGKEEQRSMEGKKFTPQEEREIRKIKRTNCIIFGFFVLLAILVAIWLGTYLYWHTFTSEKWQANPERRATMVADLLADYQLVGMTEDALVALGNYYAGMLLGQIEPDSTKYNREQLARLSLETLSKACNMNASPYLTSLMARVNAAIASQP